MYAGSCASSWIVSAGSRGSSDCGSSSSWVVTDSVKVCSGGDQSGVQNLSGKYLKVRKEHNPVRYQGSGRVIPGYWKRSGNRVNIHDCVYIEAPELSGVYCERHQ